MKGGVLTDVVRVELIDTYQHPRSRSPESPLSKLAQYWKLPRVHVVH